jgi:hypothetical protein
MQAESLFRKQAWGTIHSASNNNSRNKSPTSDLSLIFNKLPSLPSNSLSFLWIFPCLHSSWSSGSYGVVSYSILYNLLSLPEYHLHAHNRILSIPFSKSARITESLNQRLFSSLPTYFTQVDRIYETRYPAVFISRNHGRIHSGSLNPFRL